MKKKTTPQITIHDRETQGVHLSGLQSGTYFQFLTPPPDRNGKARWNCTDPYQVLGTGGTTSRYMRTLHVPTGLRLDSAPKTSKVRRLALVSLELVRDDLDE